MTRCCELHEFFNTLLGQKLIGCVRARLRSMVAAGCEVCIEFVPKPTSSLANR